MPLQLVRDAAVEPLSIRDAKLHLRVDIPDDDVLIGALIAAARRFAENLTQRALIYQAWRLVIDSFPGPTLIGVPWGKTFTLPKHAIILEKSAVRRVTAINYLDMSGTPQVVPPGDYTVDYTSEPCRITPVFGHIWPIPLPQIGAIEVNFTAGYAVPVTLSGNMMTVPADWQPYSVGDGVRFSLADAIQGVLPAPLAVGTDYFIQSVVAPGIYTLSSVPGGGAITLTNAGSGTALLGGVPEGITSWMKLRVGTLYQHREEYFTSEKSGKVLPLPFVDRLLDPYRVVF
ncbi:phage head-tail connector protein [Halothiobacillus sp.]|uniref:head-tail connector protein n=1 Tax=Halothiobacillus sp. TaxID=1891311 RepID=UPI00262DC528|nr:phage head-tail connector protein [Halothiobacillus sp.]